MSDGGNYSPKGFTKAQAKKKFMDNMIKRGYTKAEAKKIFDSEQRITYNLDLRKVENTRKYFRKPVKKYRINRKTKAKTGKIVKKIIKKVETKLMLYL